MVLFSVIRVANLLQNDRMHTPCLRFNDLREGVCILFYGGGALECTLLGSSSLAKNTILLVTHPAPTSKRRSTKESLQ